MFDFAPMGLDAAGAAAAVESAHAGVLERECRLFQLAAHWADLHAPDSHGPDRWVLDGAERGRTVGGVGTPEVLEFAAAELGARMETSGMAAQALMADALDVRHRLPLLWSLVRAGGVRVWRARKVAVATRHLGVVAAAAVDRAVAGSVGLLPWGRFEQLLDAKVVEADPGLAEERARLWESERFVRAGRSRQGLKTLVARAAAGDVVVFLATVNRVAEILAVRGDRDSVEVRRSKAVGILAQPALALELLWAHRDDTPAADVADQPDPDQPVEEPDLFDDPGPADVPGSGGEPTDRSGLVLRKPPARRPERPRVVLYIHLSAEALQAGPLPRGVARFEGVGPVTSGQVRRFLADADAEIRVQPVVDINDTPAPVDAYEVPDRMREQLVLAGPGSGFPYSPSLARRMDLDHTTPYQPAGRGGPPGQTRVGGLNRLTRHEHRVKTHSRWRVRQPGPQTTVWRSPYGGYYLVTRAGTQALGSGVFARAVWRAAAQQSEIQIQPGRSPDRPRLLEWQGQPTQARPGMAEFDPSGMAGTGLEWGGT